MNQTILRTGYARSMSMSWSRSESGSWSESLTGSKNSNNNN